MKSKTTALSLMMVVYFIFASGCKTLLHKKPGSQSSKVQVWVLTDQNRRYQDSTGSMFGGWGPHLRGMMRASDGSFWFTVDQGPSVNENKNILYYRFQNSTWNLVGSQPNLEGVQQNTATIMHGRYLLSYGISITSRYIEECYFDTLNYSYKACNAITINGIPYRVVSSWGLTLNIEYATIKQAMYRVGMPTNNLYYFAAGKKDGNKNI